RVFKAWWIQRRQPGYRHAVRAFFSDLRRDFTPNRIRRFGQALVLANETPDDIKRYYAHFLHTPASVTYYASLISGRPWSVSAHAKDIWTIPQWEKREKLAHCDWAVTCTAANAEHLSALSTTVDKVQLLYHGLDFARFTEFEKPTTGRDGSDPQNPLQIVSVGRAVDKKGYADLLKAFANLPEELQWRFTHIGGGELLGPLKAQAVELGIADRIEWCGARPQNEVIERYRRADLFVLPSRISDDGDRDGLPNVLMEAQSQKLACLSTNISGIPELIKHGETGWLVPENSPDKLCTALVLLARDIQQREQLAQAGFERVTTVFSLTRGIDQLVEKFSNDENWPGARTCD
ncbi:MAG: glycosyltransferase family 4 protein, partial [Pseudomonadota bacterium]